MNLMTWILVVLWTLLHADGREEGCPLKFGDFPYRCPSTCNSTGISTSGLESSDCCMSALTYLSHVLAIHTNMTAGQPLYLDATTETACAEGARKLNLGIDFNFCQFSPPLYTAYTSPCNYGAVDELKQNLTTFGSSFADILDACRNVDDPAVANSCLEKFSSASALLSSKLNDTNDSCEAAILISVVSTDVSNDRWIAGLYESLKLGPVYQVRTVAAPNKAIERERNLELGLIFVSVIVGVMLLAMLLILMCNSRNRKTSENAKKKGAGSSFEDCSDDKEKQLLHNEALYAFSRKEIWKATANFCSQNFIGEGSAGMVHKGVLPSGQLVAVKHIDKEKKADTFLKEIASLSKVRHPNLVSLLGYCQSGEDYFLVYEYCSNGNLWQWLFGDGRPLTWEERVNIAVGSARALWFLHTNPGGVIIHRDVKPTNILLNDHLDAKVSDFGLSKLIAMEESHVFTEVKGTSGYLDPEYMSRGQLTLASDIFSFGIVLLQLVSGRRPLELNPGHRYSLVRSAKRVVEKGSDINKFVDPRLEGRFSVKAAKSIIEIAVFCTAQGSTNRPSIKEIKEVLEAAWRMTTTTMQEMQTSQDSTPSRFVKNIEISPR